MPKVVDEVKRVQKHFPTTISLADRKATAASALKAMKQHPFVHFACLGEQSVGDPTKSAFFLGDGPLELSKLMSASLDHAELAMLSACEAATGVEELPDEAMQLAASMLAVGYRSVVGTMWSIRDDDAPVVADGFYKTYRELRRNLGRAEESAAARALHQALEVLRERVGERQFSRWAPFAHFGI